MSTLNFGERLLKLRKHKGISQGVLADTVGCSLATISRLERQDELDGVASPLLIKIAKTFGVPLLWLACGEGPEPTAGDFAGAMLAGVVGDMEVEGLRVHTPMAWDSFRYVLMAEDGYPCKMGDVLMVDTMTDPGPGDDFAAMTNEGMLYAKLISVMGKIPVFQRFHGSATERLDLSKVAWMGTVTGTLAGKRVTAAA
jgi:transcriptional regulator with XRE-family HTH domain